MTNPVQTQASKLWQTITAPDTAATYQKTGALTWAILKDTGYLLWLVLCLGLVGGEWLWKTGYKTGWDVRDWVNNLDKPKSDRPVSNSGASVSELLKSSVNSAITTAKTQLGIEPTAPTPPAQQVTSPPPAAASADSIAPLPVTTPSVIVEAPPTPSDSTPDNTL